MCFQRRTWRGKWNSFSIIFTALAEAAYYSHLIYFWLVFFEVFWINQTAFRNNSRDYYQVTQPWKQALAITLFFALGGDFAVEILILNGPESQSTKAVLNILSRLLGGCLLPLLIGSALAICWLFYCSYRCWPTVSSQNQILLVISVYFCVTQLLFLGANRFQLGRASGRKVLLNTLLSNLYVATISFLHLWPLPVYRPPVRIYEMPAERVGTSVDDSTETN